MSEQVIAEMLRPRLVSLRRDASELGCLPAAVEVAIRLDRALERLDSKIEDQRPFCAAVVGGTGVGKSELFNQIVGVPNASPPSDTKRCFTQRPFVACRDSARPHLTALNELDAKYVAPSDIWQDNCVFIDTPDIDGMVPQNLAVTRKIIDAADLLVYVTDPDKRANFDALRMVREWDRRKRWLFVLNKSDQSDGELSEVRADFDCRLRELGFEPNAENRFMVSARNPDQYEFSTLRAALLAPWSSEAIAKTRVAGTLGYVDHALAAEVADPIRDVAEKLQGSESELEAVVRAAYRKGATSPTVAADLRSLILDRAWQLAPSRVGGPMAVVLAIRARFSTLSTAFMMNRLLGGAVGLLAGAGSAAIAAIRGTLALQRVYSLMPADFHAALRDVSVRSRRIIEDHGLAALLMDADPSLRLGASAASTTNPPANRFDPLTMIQSALGRSLDSGVDAGLLDKFQRDLERMAEKIVRPIGSKPFAVCVNLLPMVVLIQAGARIAVAWTTAEYLEGAFYWTAIGAFLLSLLPGYLFVAGRIARSAAILDTSAIFDELSSPEATFALRFVRERLRAFLAAAELLQQDVARLRRTRPPIATIDH